MLRSLPLLLLWAPTSSSWATIRLLSASPELGVSETKLALESLLDMLLAGLDGVVPTGLGED